MKQGSFSFIGGMFFIVCIGLPSLYWFTTTSYQYFAAVPSYINQRKIRVINPFLIDEDGLYSEREKWLCTAVCNLARAEGLPKPLDYPTPGRPHFHIYVIVTM